MFSISDHLKERWLDTNLHWAWLDESENRAVFPLWNLSGEMVGYQNYSPLFTKTLDNNENSGRYYTFRRPDAITVWGLESWRLSNTLFITEGIFDAARLTYHGASAVAVLSNNPNLDTRNWLYMVGGVRRTVSVCDNDVPGKKLMKLGNHSVVVSSGHDLGDASEEEVKQILETYM